jgi:hypothetical protein
MLDTASKEMSQPGDSAVFFVLVKFAMPKQTQSARSRTITVIEPLHC